MLQRLSVSVNADAIDNSTAAATQPNVVHFSKWVMLWLIVHQWQYFRMLFLFLSLSPQPIILTYVTDHHVHRIVSLTLLHRNLVPIKGFIDNQIDFGRQREVLVGKRIRRTNLHEFSLYVGGRQTQTRTRRVIFLAWSYGVHR